MEGSRTGWSLGRRWSRGRGRGTGGQSRTSWACVVAGLGESKGARRSRPGWRRCAREGQNGTNVPHRRLNHSGLEGTKETGIVIISKCACVDDDAPTPGEISATASASGTGSRLSVPSTPKFGEKVEIGKKDDYSRQWCLRSKISPNCTLQSESQHVETSESGCVEIMKARSVSSSVCHPQPK